MSDTIETKVAETVAPVQDAAVDIKALSEQLEAIKKAQAGSDKAYQEAAKKTKELEAENERLKKEKMSEKEKAEFELAKERAEIEKIRREANEATLRLSKMKILGEKGVPAELFDYISGATEDEIRENTDTFVKRFQEAVSKGVNEKLVGTAKPKAGAEPQKGIDLSKMGFQEIERLAMEGKL